MNRSKAKTNDKISIGSKYFLAKFYKTDVKNPCGKKKADSQYAFNEFFSNQEWKNEKRFRKSTYQLANGFIDGYALELQIAGT